MNIKRSSASRCNQCNRCNNSICTGSIRFDNQFVCNKEWNAKYKANHTKQISAAWPKGWGI